MVSKAIFVLSMELMKLRNVLMACSSVVLETFVPKSYRYWRQKTFRFCNSALKTGRWKKSIANISARHKDQCRFLKRIAPSLQHPPFHDPSCAHRFDPAVGHL